MIRATLAHVLALCLFTPHLSAGEHARAILDAVSAVPAPGVGLMHVQWVRQDDRRLKMQIDSPKPWRLAIGREVKPQGAGRTSLELALTRTALWRVRRSRWSSGVTI